MEYLSCSDLNISCGGIFIFASFAACKIKHTLTSQLITDNLSHMQKEKQTVICKSESMNSQSFLKWKETFSEGQLSKS